MARLGPRLLLPMVHLDSVDWTGLDWTDCATHEDQTFTLQPRWVVFPLQTDTTWVHGGLAGSQARRQTTMIDHAKHKTLKQCATRQCCRQESRGEQPGQSTRQPGPGFAAARIRDDQHNALQTGQASVGHGRALFFLSRFSLQRRPHPKTRAKTVLWLGP